MADFWLGMINSILESLPVAWTLIPPGFPFPEGQSLSYGVSRLFIVWPLDSISLLGSRIDELASKSEGKQGKKKSKPLLLLLFCGLLSEGVARI